MTYKEAIMFAQNPNNWEVAQVGLDTSIFISTKSVNRYEKVKQDGIYYTKGGYEEEIGDSITLKQIVESDDWKAYYYYEDTEPAYEFQEYKNRYEIALVLKSFEFKPNLNQTGKVPISQLPI